MSHAPDEQDDIDARLRRDGERWQAGVPPLADQRSSFARRAARRGSSPLATLAGAALVMAVVAVVGLAVALRPEPGPAALGPSSATMQPSTVAARSAPPAPASGEVVNPSASPRATTAPTPAATALPTTQPTPEPSPISPLPGWSSLGYADAAVWSPDGRHIAVMNGGDTVIVDADGSVSHSFTGANEAIWVDSGQLLLRDLGGDPISGAPSASGTDAVYLAALDSGALQLVGNNSDTALASGTGPVAFGSDQGAGSFRVWSTDGWSDEQPGYPLTWSAQGDKLAIMHLNPDAPIGLEGTVDVLSWPSLASIARDDSHVTSPNFAQFDPSGSRLAFKSMLPILVLDLASGSTTQIGPDNAGIWFGWDSDGNAVIADAADQSISAYDARGRVTQHWNGEGDAVVGVADGSALLFYVNDYGGKRPPLYLHTAGRRRVFEVQDSADRRPMLAPDGHAVLVFAPVNNRQTLLLSPE